jgi:hypothetical protein
VAADEGEVRRPRFAAMVAKMGGHVGGTTSRGRPCSLADFQRQRRERLLAQANGLGKNGPGDAA